MRRRDLLCDLGRHGCEMLRGGSKHTVDINRQARTVSTIPRHREIAPLDGGHVGPPLRLSGGRLTAFEGQ